MNKKTKYIEIGFGDKEMFFSADGIMPLSKLIDYIDKHFNEIVKDNASAHLEIVIDSSCYEKTLTFKLTSGVKLKND